MRQFSVRAMGFCLMGLVAIAGTVCGGLAWYLSREMAASERFWRQYQDLSSIRTHAVATIVKHLGYGQMIHHFKTYVLGRDAARVAKVRMAAGGVLAAIDQYYSAATSAAERQALNDIRQVVLAYARNIAVAEQLVQAGKTAREIDQVVKIDDRPALKGLGILKAQIMASRARNAYGMTKSDVLGEFYAALGFGGLIHQFKNYVLRQQAPLLDQVKGTIGALKASEWKYRQSFALTPEEDAALKTLMGVVTQYERMLDKVQTLISQGLTPEQIESQLHVDDGPALRALQALQAAIAQEIVTEKTRLTQRFTAATMGLFTLALAGIGSALVVVFLLWRLVLARIAAPLHQVSLALFALAKGQLDVAVSGIERKDEIGTLARLVEYLRLRAQVGARLVAARGGER